MGMAQADYTTQGINVQINLTVEQAEKLIKILTKEGVGQDEFAADLAYDIETSIEWL